MPHTSTLTPQYEWNPALGSTGRYIDTVTKQAVPFSVVTDALELQIIDARNQMNIIGLQLANGEISIAEAQLLGMNEIKIVNTVSASLAKGGWAKIG